jgi:hypothetical protein
MELLKQLELDVLPPEKLFVVYSRKREGTLTYHFAHIYNDIDGHKEPVGNLLAFDRFNLEKQLKEQYDIPMTTRGTLSGFLDWYENVLGKRMTFEEVWNSNLCDRF